MRHLKKFENMEAYQDFVENSGEYAEPFVAWIVDEDIIDAQYNPVPADMWIEAEYSIVPEE